MIISERFRAERDDYGWSLIETKPSKDKDGNATTKESKTYYPNIKQVLNEVADRQIGRCENLADIRRAVADMERVISGASL